MEPISGLMALFEILRRTAGDKPQSASGARSAAGEPTRPTAPRMAYAELEQHIRLKLKEQAGDALLSVASKRWVIASLLSWEFDSQLQNEPKFNALVRTVQQSIDGDARLKARFERILRQLCR